MVVFFRHQNAAQVGSNRLQEQQQQQRQHIPERTAAAASRQSPAGGTCQMLCAMHTVALDGSQANKCRPGQKVPEEKLCP